jgi:hypothetical protein
VRRRADPDGFVVTAPSSRTGATDREVEALAERWTWRAARIRRDMNERTDLTPETRTAWALEAGAWGLAALELRASLLAEQPGGGK